MEFPFQFRGLAPFLFLTFFVSFTLGQPSPKTPRPVLDKRNPDRWFEILIPKTAGELRRFADVDGGFYDASNLRVTFSYWTYENTPNFIRNAGVHSSEEPDPVCPEPKKRRIFRATISSTRAVVQTCEETGASNLRYLYYVSFPELDVFDRESFAKGKFTLAINYNEGADIKLASRIARSIRFSRKLTK